MIMQTTFLNAAGTVLFVRDDMEQGNWTQEEYTVNATFPYISGKVIERGQRISFRDPATGNMEFFEIINVSNTEPDHYQQLIAESIAVSELSDEHMQAADIMNKTAAQALTTALTGTLWAVGNSTVSATSSVKLSRGSVWQGVLAIANNWNAYITQRVTVDTAGNITGRYLDISPAQGTWRGLRLSVDKNMSDAAITYDGSEILTALYGYGGKVDVAQSSGDDENEELTFKDVVWTATSAHPAKPSGQTYLEWPEKTALYGRNGRPRFGYYQNADITDANTLLEKTWEALQQSCNPKINISGTVSDLYRLGYQDQPMRLHDLVIVEIRETGTVMQKQIIKLDVDLIDPTATRPEIGDYIPNIVYIAEKTDQKASGGGGGGGGGSPKGKTELENQQSTFESDWIKNSQEIGMVVGIKNGTKYIKAASIVASINNDGGTNIKLSADTIDIDGLIASLDVKDVMVRNFNAHQGEFTSDLSVLGDLDCAGDIGCTKIEASNIEATSLTVTGSSISVGGDAASWQSYTARYATLGTKHYFLYSSGSGNLTPSGTAQGNLVSSYTNTTLHYLGKAST